MTWGSHRAIALALASNGCKVIVNYASNEAAAAEVCNEIQSLYGRQSLALYSFNYFVCRREGSDGSSYQSQLWECGGGDLIIV